MAASKRIERFRNDLIAAIPRFPNDRVSQQVMQQKHITDVLITYVNWRIRFIGQRPRSASVCTDAKADPRWTGWEPQVRKLLTKVRAGDDLTPHLSLAPKTQGFTPASSAPGATPEERWSDKDQLLNVMGFHHLHLGDITAPLEHADRTNELAFCHVTRNEFEVVAIFDHGVFERGTAERMRLLTLHEQRLTRGAPSGSAILMSAITTAGTTIGGTMAAQSFVRLINAIDPMLDDPSRLSEIQSYGISVARPEKLKWMARHLDLGLYDKEEANFLILQKGPT
jgi:hypothetical protein